ncbi:MAG: transcriptional regulator [Pseudonocardiaceae bacterium]|nr:transcriptional regulator [Pseudonocardiaceae bacterium]
MSLVDQHRSRELTESQREWLRVREYLQANRYELGQAAADLYPETLKVAGTPLLTRREWLPTEPIPLDAIDLELASETPFAGLASDDPATASLRPERSDGSRYSTYSAAMADLAAPAVFENRSTYRLLSADLSGKRGRLVFGRGSYFDGIGLGEAVAHEYAAARLNGADTPLRNEIGDPCDPARRPTNLAISTLTVRHDPATGDASFLLHWRDPAKVGHAGGLYMVIPVGIFQATDDQPWNELNDFSLWRCIVREYAEELLGEPEDHGSGLAPIDYDSWPLAADMTEELNRGGLRASALGIGVDPLTFATDVLTAIVFDAPLFDHLFGDLVHVNDEGALVSAGANGTSLPGFNLTEREVGRLVERGPMQSAGAAALALVWNARDVMLEG